MSYPPCPSFFNKCQRYKIAYKNLLAKYAQGDEINCPVCCLLKVLYCLQRNFSTTLEFSPAIVALLHEGR
jgi:hypothetical protein